MINNQSDLRWDSPSPGFWQLDANHYPRPVTAFHQEVFSEEFRAGMGPKTRDYGLLVDFEFVCVNGFMYIGAHPVGAPRGAKGPPPKWLFKLVLNVHPEIRRRLKAATRALHTTKVWREETKRWEEEIKPAAIRAHLSLQSIDPSRLPTDLLLVHLEECRNHVKKMIRQHHSFNLTTFLPMGDFLSHASEWTGLPPAKLLPLMKGSSPVSAGVTKEFSRLITALKNDNDALALFESGGQPSRVLDLLRARPGEVGEAVKAYLDLAGYRLVNSYDMSDPYLLEMPEVLIRAIHSSVHKNGREASPFEMQNQAEGIRERVPEIHRDMFDALLAEARHTYRLRDERGLYSDLWAYGLMRRAVMAAGTRLAEGGRLAEPAHLLDATYSEMRELIQNGSGPSPAELERRARYRATHNFTDAPAHLGTPSLPPPFDWLPPVGRRMAKAVEAVLQAIYYEPEEKVVAEVIHGLGVSGGEYEGIARVVAGPVDFGRLQKGDILVTRSTSAAFNVVLPLIGAVVTDRGGVLSHAAIVAREYGIPAVVGTQQATRLIADGVRVRVNGTLGEVLLLP